MAVWFRYRKSSAVAPGEGMRPMIALFGRKSRILLPPVTADLWRFKDGL
jgi:hypothetical protein